MDIHLKEFQRLNVTNQDIFDADVLIILKDGTNLSSWSDVESREEILYLSEDLSDAADVRFRYKDLKSLKAIILRNLSEGHFT